MTFQKYYHSTFFLSAIRFKRFLFTILLLTSGIYIQAQNCNCTIDQVQNNSVQPCDYVIGTVVTVSSVSQVWDAINQANSSGGNMTILIEDGIYQVATAASFPYITASNIVIKSVSGNRDAVVLRGAGMMPINTIENGLLIAGNNVTIADLTIREVANHGIQVSGHNLYVHNVRIQNAYEQLLKGSTTEASIDGAVIQCSLFEYTAGIGPNFYIGGLDIHKGNGWLVRDNIFKDIASPEWSVAEHAIHFWDDAKDNIVERNLIINCDRGIGFGLGENDPQNEGGVIRNNMVYNNGVGLFNDVGIGLESSPNTKVYNNTVFVAYDNAIEYRFESTSNVDIVNNLTNKSITSRNGGTGNLQTNVENALANWFVNTAAGDLHLASINETVFDQGTDLSLDVSNDFDQTARPLNAGFDIGAHELLSTGVIAFEDRFKGKIFPNPASQNLTVEFKEKGLYALSVFNAIGQLIKEETLTQFSIIDIVGLNNGTYFYQIKDESGNSLNGKFIKVE